MKCRVVRDDVCPGAPVPCIKAQSGSLQLGRRAVRKAPMTNRQTVLERLGDLATLQEANMQAASLEAWKPGTLCAGDEMARQ